jgi:pSer/pThr/pTyr-binding forkhead associated (FHA) protein
MAKLVVLSEGLSQTYELKVDKTTIGRVDDNTFQIAQSSISSHHCEILLRGNDVVVKDLNSTNGTFIDKDQITGEGVLKVGQILRLGEVQIRLESDVPPPGTKQNVDSTMIMPRGSRGVSLEQLEQGPHGFDTTKGVFTKKKNTTNKYFIIGGIVLLLVIVVAFLMVITQLNAHK